MGKRWGAKRWGQIFILDKDIDKNYGSPNASECFDDNKKIYPIKLSYK